MTGEKAERFVVFNLRLMAIGFAITGFFFIAWPDGTLARLTEFGDNFGDFTAAPETDERLWLSLGFAYMVVITGICVVVQLDVVRYRPLLLVLAAGKAASSLAALGFFVFDQDVFIYLLNFLVDVLRADEPRPSWPKEEVLEAAPDPAEGAFRVPSPQAES